MDKPILYTHGETGLEFVVTIYIDEQGNVEVKKVLHAGEDIKPIISDDLLIDIEMFCEDYIGVTLTL